MAPAPCVGTTPRSHQSTVIASTEVSVTAEDLDEAGLDEGASGEAMAVVASALSATRLLFISSQHAQALFGSRTTMLNPGNESLANTSHSSLGSFSLESF